MIKALFIALVVCGIAPFVIASLYELFRERSGNFLDGIETIFIFIGTAIVSFVVFVVSTFVIVIKYQEPPVTPKKPSAEHIQVPAMPEEKPLNEFSKWLTTPLINPKSVNELPKENQK